MLQLVTANDIDTTEDAYLEVIEAKTAALFARGRRIGAVVAERPRAEEEALDGYGRNLGIAFQLVDDMLDYSADQAELGKTVGDDFREGKITLPVMLAYARGDDEERAFWRRTLEELRAGARGSRPRHRADAPPRCAATTPWRAPRHYGAMAASARRLPGRPREAGAMLDARRFLHRARLLKTETTARTGRGSCDLRPAALYTRPLSARCRSVGQLGRALRSVRYR